MMRCGDFVERSVRFALTMFGLVAAAAAAAQDTEIGSRLTKERNIVSSHGTKSSRIGAVDMMTCVVRNRPALAARYLQTTSAVEMKAMAPGLFREISSCPYLGGGEFGTARQVGWSEDVGRGMIAEALLARLPRTVPLPALPLVKEYRSPWADVSGRNSVVEEMAVCVAATNPAAIDALVATTVDTPAESAAIGAVGPSLGPCLSATAKLTANRASLRAALAEALYHRVANDAPAVAQATP